MLGRRQALQDLVADRLDAYPLDERLDDAEIDVRLEQRETNLAQRRIDRPLRQPGFPSQGLEDILKPGAEGLEHSVALTRWNQCPLAGLTCFSANGYLSGL